LPEIIPPKPANMTKPNHSTKSLPPVLYRWWQQFFTEQKLRPLLDTASFFEAASILELGCGSGNNRPYFVAPRYVGVDLDPAAIQSASKKNDDHFICADFTQEHIQAEDFDVVLLHSVLHHIPDSSILNLKEKFKPWIKKSGRVYIVDAIRDEKIGIPRIMAAADRGKFFRTRSQWNQLINEILTVEHREEFDLKIMGITLYKMFYVRGIPK